MSKTQLTTAKKFHDKNEGVEHYDFEKISRHSKKSKALARIIFLIQHPSESETENLDEEVMNLVKSSGLSVNVTFSIKVSGNIIPDHNLLSLYYSNRNSYSYGGSPSRLDEALIKSGCDITSKTIGLTTFMGDDTLTSFINAITENNIDVSGVSGQNNNPSDCSKTYLLQMMIRRNQWNHAVTLIEHGYDPKYIGGSISADMLSDMVLFGPVNDGMIMTLIKAMEYGYEPNLTEFHPKINLELSKDKILKLTAAASQWKSSQQALINASNSAEHRRKINGI